MMHTTAGADRKELSAKKAPFKSRLERWHGNYRTGLCFSYGRQLYCDGSSHSKMHRKSRVSLGRVGDVEGQATLPAVQEPRKVEQH